MIKSKRKSLIENANGENQQPQRSKSSSDLLLPLGNRRYAKLQQRGRTTPAGRFYFQHTQTNSQTYDIRGTVIQRDSTVLLITNGKARVLRRLVGDAYSYTKLGNPYFGATKRCHISCMSRPPSKRLFHRPRAGALWYHIMRSCSKN